MKLSNLNEWLTLAANIGVLAGLFVLIYEINQNTDALRAQTVQEVQTNLRAKLDFYQKQAEISTKLPDERTPAEGLMRAQYFFRAMRSYENQWYHYSKGYLDEELFFAYQQHLRVTLGLEDFLERWNLRKQQGFFHPGFVEYVDDFLINNPPVNIDTLEPI